MGQVRAFLDNFDGDVTRDVAHGRPHALGVGAIELIADRAR